MTIFVPDFLNLISPWGGWNGGGGLPVGCPNSKGEKVSANLNLNPFRENGGDYPSEGTFVD
jgi:hypothetical protein